MFSRLSFIDNEIAGQEDDVIREAIEISAENRHYLQNLLRMKPHLLHPDDGARHRSAVPDDPGALSDLQYGKAGRHEI